MALSGRQSGGIRSQTVGRLLSEAVTKGLAESETSLTTKMNKLVLIQALSSG